MNIITTMNVVNYNNDYKEVYPTFKIELSDEERDILYKAYIILNNIDDSMETNKIEQVESDFYSNCKVNREEVYNAARIAFIFNDTTMGTI